MQMSVQLSLQQLETQADAAGPFAHPWVGIDVVNEPLHVVEHFGRIQRVERTTGEDDDDAVTEIDGRGRVVSENRALQLA